MTVALGAVCGIVAGAFAARLLRGYLFGVAPVDPATFLLVPVGPGALAVLATLAGALRATQVDPAEALRAL